MAARRPSDTGALALLAAGLLVWFAGPFLLKSLAFPLGSDAPVYLWWTRLAGVEGLSAVATRPGVPAIALAVAGALGISVVTTIAALEIAGSVAIGLAAATLVRILDEHRPTWLLAGALAGTFAVHLAVGYVANLIFATAFLAAAVALSSGTRRGATAAAIALGAGGIAHPLFLGVGTAILLLTAAIAWREDDRESSRLIAGATVAGGAILGIAALAMLRGPAPLDVDTSRDGFLRRAGLDAMLRDAYVDRFLRRWPRYVPWASLPLAWVGLRAQFGASTGAAHTRTAGAAFVRRFLLAWTAVAVSGVAISCITRWVPPDRFITFAFVIPMLGAVGAVRLARSARLPAFARGFISAGLVGAMVAGAGLAWFWQEPFLYRDEIAGLRVANAVAVARPDTALLFPVASEATAFLATRAGNVIRSAVPPERIRDVTVIVAGSAPGDEGEALGRLTADDELRAIASHGGSAQRVLVIAFAPRIGRGAPWTTADIGALVDPPVIPGATREAIGPATPVGMASSGLATLMLLGLVGLAWSLLATRSRVAERTGSRATADAAGATDPAGAATALAAPASLAVAPSAGMSVLILVAVVVDRLGLRLGERGPALAATLIAGALGLAAWVARERRARTQASS